MNGKLLVFEGIDGCGAETQTKKLLHYLNEKSIPAERLEYPDYDSKIGRLIDEYLHNEEEFPLDIQFLLHSTDRIKHRDRINNLQQNGTTVICDRYYTTILAYQCAQGFPLEKALKMAEMFEVPKPDKILLLKISPETSLKRKIKEKQGNLDRFEKNRDLQRRVAEQYDSLVRDSVFGPWYAIDGEKPIEDVFSQVKKVLNV